MWSIAYLAVILMRTLAPVLSRARGEGGRVVEAGVEGAGVVFLPIWSSRRGEIGVGLRHPDLMQALKYGTTSNKQGKCFGLQKSAWSN